MPLLTATKLEIGFTAGSIELQGRRKRFRNVEEDIVFWMRVWERVRRPHSCSPVVRKRDVFTSALGKNRGCDREGLESW